MLRIKNEDQFIKPCIESILPWFDEVVVCLQNCTDNTEEIVRSFDNPKIKIHLYDTDSWPNGDGYINQDATSPYSRTYFYNWCLDKTNYSHVCKWDGDMVAMDWLGDQVRHLLHIGSDSISFKGVDIVGEKMRHVGNRMYCATETRIFKKHNDTKYINGAKCEKLSTHHGTTMDMGQAAYLHFKWAKPLSNATQAWPDDWRESAHFQNIIKRSQPVAEYTGKYPSHMPGLVDHG